MMKRSPQRYALAGSDKPARRKPHQVGRPARSPCSRRLRSTRSRMKASIVIQHAFDTHEDCIASINAAGLVQAGSARGATSELIDLTEPERLAQSAKLATLIDKLLSGALGEISSAERSTLADRARREIETNRYPLAPQVVV
jgi:hypothetical protein